MSGSVAAEADVVRFTATDVLERILGHAEDQPERPAAKDTSCELDYAGLRAEVSALAAGLAARGIGAGDRVAIDLPNSVDFLVASLACMWVGAMFIPLAVSDPEARVTAIIADCKPALVLTNDARADVYPLSTPITSIATRTVAPPSPVAPADRPAYAIYTSGTTGTPKGVVIGRPAFAAVIGVEIDCFELDRETRALCVSPFHFDGSFGTLFPAVAAGGFVMIPPRDSLLFARFFFRTVIREQITFTGFSSSYLRLLLASPQLNTLSESSLKLLALGGEACSALDIAQLWGAKADLRVFNRYGPTETTIAVTHFPVTREVVDGGGPVPIGKPNEGTSFFLIDTDGAIVDQAGQVGELYIGGVQLMAGYWGAPELTADVMRDDIIGGRTVYRTGDLVMRAEDGNYVYIDRADRVVKRNAVRISLVELAEVMRGLPGVTAATCATFEYEGALGIAAFVVTPTPQTVAELRRAAAQRLPATMLPDTFVVVDVLPLTSSSKVDERRLLQEAGLKRL
jgi:D-alanine--poly(phosphoribitol) ligase subunit 1